LRVGGQEANAEKHSNQEIGREGGTQRRAERGGFIGKELGDRFFTITPRGRAIEKSSISIESKVSERRKLLEANRVSSKG